jgi:hypothetical protein
MNYAIIYVRLINRARRRGLVPGVHFEKHHISPKCLGGTDAPSNLVFLTPEEHYLAHQLLVKLHPSNGKIIWAAIAMTNTTSRSGAGRRGNKLYGWLRRQFIERQRGREYSQETRAKIGEKSKARNQGAAHPMFGRKHSAETRAKISQGNLGKKHTPRAFSDLHRQNIALARQKKSWASTLGRRLANNGVEHKFITPDQLPAGWKWGALPRSNKVFLELPVAAQLRRAA